jgi:hypothetical protein
LGFSGSFFFGGSAFCSGFLELDFLLAEEADAALETVSFGRDLGDAMGGPCFC